MDGYEPLAKRDSSLVHERPTGNAELVLAGRALELAVVLEPRDMLMSAPRANNTIRPSHLLQEIPRLLFAVDLGHEFDDVHALPP